MKSSKRKSKKRSAKKKTLRINKKLCFAALAVVIAGCLFAAYLYKHRDRSIANILSSADYSYDTVYCIERTVSASTMSVPADIAHSIQSEYDISPNMSLAKICEIYTLTDRDHFMKNCRVEYAPSSFYTALMKGMNLETGLTSETLTYGQALSGNYYFRASDYNDGTTYLLANVPEDVSLRAGGVDPRVPSQLKTFADKLIRESSSMEKIIIEDVVVGYKVYLSLDASNFGYLAGLFESTQGFSPEEDYTEYEGWMTFDEKGRLTELYLGASNIVEDPTEWETAFKGYEICVEYFYDKNIDLNVPFDCTESCDYAQVSSYFS